VLDDISQAGSLPGSRLRVDRNDNLTPGDSSASNLHQIALNIKQKMPAGFSAAFNSFFRRNDQESFVRGLSSTSTLETATRSSGATAQLSHDGAIFSRKNLAALGVEYAHNRFTSTSESEFICCPGAFVTEQFTRENIAGIYFTDSLTIFDALVVSVGFRYDWDRLDFTGKTDPTFSGAKQYSHFSPKTGLVYTPVQDLSFYFNYSEGMRVPTVQEVFALGPFGSNLNLKAMTSRNFEVGLNSKPLPWIEASLALYYMPVRDEILFIATDPLDPFSGRNENIKRTLRRGVEASIKARPVTWMDGFINYSVMKATFENDFFIPGNNFIDAPRLVKKGDELPAVPRHRVGVGVNVRPIDGLTLSLLGSYVSGQYHLRDEPNQVKQVADYFVLNSRIAYQWRQWTAHVTLNNLTNQKYSTSGILVGNPFNESFRVPAPGFNAFAGLSFKY
jgi:outer membrane receptor protein involved in Fe transport